jgi:peptidoglycan/LPS O-acetylase OafA/YrhL
MFSPTQLGLDLLLPVYRAGITSLSLSAEEVSVKEEAAAAGVVIARFASFFVRLGRVTGLFLLAAGIAMFFVPNPLGFAVGSTCLVGGAVALEPQVRRSPSLSLLFLGNASYSIYLAHPFAQRAFAVALTHLKLSTALMLVLGTGAGVIGALAYVLIERPLMAWLRKLRWPAQSDNRAVAGTKLD